MTAKYGYIYIRNHESYDVYNACKMGKTKNIPERDSLYSTGEIKRGYFKEVFEVPIFKLGIIERLLQNEFQNLHIYVNSGIEFYNKKITTQIEPYLKKINIKYKRLTKLEISNLTRSIRIKKLYKKINIKSLIRILKSKKEEPKPTYTPRTDQIDIINKSTIHFEKNDKGVLVLMCGVGKTLISLWVTQNLNMNRILIGVPNTLLLKQWQKVIGEIFDNIPYLIISSGVCVERIIEFLKKYNNKCIIITTYNSSHKVYKAVKKSDFVFDMKINDEVHHLTTNNLNKEGNTYVNMLKIKSRKQLSLTATLKILEDEMNKRDDEISISNDNIKHFGKIIDKKSLLWAINKQIICDYVIQTIITDEEKLENQLLRFNINEENGKRLFLSAFSALKSILNNNSHHLLIYCNNRNNTVKIIEYIKILLEQKYFDIPELYYSNYHSEMTPQYQTDILDKFKNAKYGIITCVYCLGEGWDLPLLDGVVFAENMTSNIRIVQSALRASRKNKNDTKKITKIILPILNRYDWLENNENSDLKKVREIIYQMGLEDETISQKIKVFRMCLDKQNPKEKHENNKTDSFGEYDSEITQKLRLKTTRRTVLSTTYEKARKIIAESNIKSKEDYYKLCERDNRLTTEPELVFKGKFTNWINYLSIERVYYDLETCKDKIGKYLSTYPEIKKYSLNLSFVSSELCKLDQLFPPNDLWVDYYNVKNLQDIIIITGKKKKIKALL
jgi:superfamily II DNA or RNA helicase